MYHSITFGYGNYENGHFENEANTWNDWHLIPSSRPSMALPKVNTNLIQVPGQNGSLDMTEDLTGLLAYGNRSGSWEFIVDNGHDLWVTIKETITEFMHGQRLRCFSEDDPDHVYSGRFSVNEWKSQEHYSTITIDFDIDPFRSSADFSDDWLWDPFNFDTDRTDGCTV